MNPMFTFNEVDEALSRTERTAFTAWFRGAFSEVTDFKNHGIWFGKAECEWVDFKSVWLGKFIDLSLFEVTKSATIALGMQGQPLVYKYKFKPTKYGFDYYDYLMKPSHQTQ